jgi:photosystem I P700 chlorophyll a apoprotein A1
MIQCDFRSPTRYVLTTRLQLQPIFAQWIQNIHLLAPGTTNALATTSYAFWRSCRSWWKNCDDAYSVRYCRFHGSPYHAFTIHVTVLILLKGVFARSSKLIPDKANLGFRFPCDGPGRGGTCQSSSWDHVFLGLFWMYNSISVVFHFSWKMQSDVWELFRMVVFHTLLVETSRKVLLQLMAGYVISYGRKLHKLFNHTDHRHQHEFLGAHFIWAFSLMFLFSGRGYWQELSQSFGLIIN